MMCSCRLISRSIFQRTYLHLDKQRGAIPVHIQYVSAAFCSGHSIAMTSCVQERQWEKVKLPFLPIETIASKVRATPEWTDSGKRCCHGMHRKNPYRRVNGRYWGIGLGSIVNCRHQLLVSRRRDMVGLHIPVPGVSSRVILSPENTAQLLWSYGRAKNRSQ